MGHFIWGKAISTTGLCRQGIIVSPIHEVKGTSISLKICNSTGVTLEEVEFTKDKARKLAETILKTLKNP